jgi:hypothetical protein
MTPVARPSLPANVIPAQAGISSNLHDFDVCLGATPRSTTLRRLEAKAARSHRLAAARNAGSRRASSQSRSCVRLRRTS